MTLSKVFLIPLVIKLKGLKIHPDEIVIIEEKISGEGKVKKENRKLIFPKKVIVIYQKIRMKMKKRIQSSRLWIQMFKNKVIIHRHNLKPTSNQYQKKSK